MISSVLDQVQKLFGRGFLIAALVPSILFLAALEIIWHGFSGLHDLFTRWAAGGLKVAAADVIFAAGGVYLLAYTLYGVRPAIYRVYQGRWSAPLRRFSQSGLLEAAAWRRSRQHLDERTSILDVPNWAEKAKFGPAYSERRLQPKQLQRLITTTKQDHQKALARLKEGKPFEEHSYWRLLVHAHLLAASAASNDSLPPDVRSKIDALLKEIRDSYSRYGAMQAAVQRMRTAADRDRIVAYQDFVSTFPIDERWLRPTRLGNVMSVAEGWTLSNYGITLNELWPRLLHVTPSESRERVEEANTYLDFTVIMSLLSLAAAGTSVFAVAYGSARVGATAWLEPLLFLIGFWIFYRLAIQAARGFVLQVQAIVDLFRLDLLDALAIERPKKPSDEKPIWTEIRRFIVQHEIPKKHVQFTTAERDSSAEPNEVPSAMTRSIIKWLTRKLDS